MEVGEALLRQIEARERLVRARVAVHAFHPAAVDVPVKDGLAMAGQTLAAGERAIKERDTRRYGFMVSLLFILLTIAGLVRLIRQSRPNPVRRDYRRYFRTTTGLTCIR
jgi:hypothetical protein